MTRRLFLTIALSLTQSHLKLQTLATKRTQYFYPINDAVVIGWYRGMSKLHSEFAELFEQLAEALSK